MEGTGICQTRQSDRAGGGEIKRFFVKGDARGSQQAGFHDPFRENWQIFREFCQTRLATSAYITMQATVNDLHCNTRRQLNAKTNPLTDEQLLLRYRQTGDRELFAQLVYRYERELYSYLRRYLGSADLAEDAFQGAFLHVHLKCDQFQKGRRFRPWLYTIATNQAIDLRRRNKRHRLVSLDGSTDATGEDVRRLVNLLESSETGPAAAAENSERDRRIRKTLDGLPESMHAVIQLVYYQGMKYREAAEVLEIPVGTVKSRMHAAIARLTDVWSEQNKVE
jgi:RNA polymerase sigma-70 factor (ECF subfamily)